MRSFVVVGHRATTSPNFSLEDIPGTSGRLDILCRCINAAFMLSHGIRKDANVYLVLFGGEPTKVLWLKGDELKHLNPDERTTAALLKKALAIAAGLEWTKSTPGIFVRIGSISEAMQDLLGARLFYLREDGIDIRNINSNNTLDNVAFILGDHIGMTPDEECLINRMGAETISVGPISLHADHCIIIINNEFDRRI